MELTELTADEQLALVGLAKLIVHADQQVSAHESQALAGIASRLGRDLWNTRVKEARSRLTTADATYDLAESLQRPEARQAILEVLEGLAGSDKVIDAEQEILVWLSQVWGLAAEEEEHEDEDEDEDEDEEVGEAFVLFDEE